MNVDLFQIKKKNGCETEEGAKKSCYRGIWNCYPEGSQCSIHIVGQFNVIPVLRELTFQEGNHMTMNQNTLKEYYVIFVH